MELDLPVEVEYFRNKFYDFDYESISIIPESGVDVDELISKIDPIIKKAKNFGYKKI